MIRKTHGLLKIISGLVVDLPTPMNINLFWNYGSLLGLTLVLQLLTGILLATRFSAMREYSFESVVLIVQDRNYGWLLRLLHSTGASLFFLFVYLHIGRGIYYGSFFKKEVWTVGVIIYLILIGTAFLGYVLPWGQISFWAATVITNLLSAIPVIGAIVVEWVWGGFAVGNPTLVRFFALHYLLPFIIAFLVVIHIYFLHEEGSSNPMGVNSTTHKVSFHYAFSVKDVLYFVVFLFSLLFLSLTTGYYFMDSENFIPANPLVTPTHIQPEWYFLFAYAILRSIPNKLGGVLALVAAVAVLFVFPITTTYTSGGVVYSVILRITFWVMVADFSLLTWLGMIPAEPPFILLAQLCTVTYFLSIALLLVGFHTQTLHSY